MYQTFLQSRAQKTFYTSRHPLFFSACFGGAECVIELYIYNRELSQLVVVVQTAASASAAAWGKTTPIVMQCLLLLLLLLLYCVMSASATVQCLLLPSAAALLWIPAIRLVSPMFGELVIRGHYHS